MSRERDQRLDEIGKKIKRESNEYASNNSHQQMGVRSGHMLAARTAPAVSLGTLNTITPCAACKLLRRRCAQECPFSPYFSPHEPHKFASVHKVFGASNVSKMLMEVPERQRADAANSLVYEANVRLRDPVYGCMGAILALQQQVQSFQAELNAVRAEILKYKYREAAAANNKLINTSPSSSNHHLPHVALLSSGTVSVAVPPPPPPPPPPPLPLPTSSSSSIAATDYNTINIPNENVGYFGSME
ncbi:LOB domain-containing protein 15 [Malania oleifera]|uniref:LOB domain-containing protein 15 n=1 Tax=Malania oleifera TaxID=397392 RepID=UPI0025AE0F21|nr:LOB domain-containing protein 15 [Malania oleifera]